MLLGVKNGCMWISASMSEFDKVVLHWINKAVKGKVQVSDDAKLWKDAAELPGGDG